MKWNVLAPQIFIVCHKLKLSWLSDLTDTFNGMLDRLETRLKFQANFTK
jgi:hypothetical protein